MAANSILPYPSYVSLLVQQPIITPRTARTPNLVAARELLVPRDARCHRCHPPMLRCSALKLLHSKSSQQSTVSRKMEVNATQRKATQSKATQRNATQHNATQQKAHAHAYANDDNNGHDRHSTTDNSTNIQTSNFKPIWILCERAPSARCAE